MRLNLFQCSLPNSNISMKTDFDTDILLTNVTHVQVLSIMLMEYGQHVNKHRYLTDKANFEKMYEVYVTYVADFDKEQRHVVTLVSVLLRQW